MASEDQSTSLILSLSNLINFRAQTTLQKAVLTYIASQHVDVHLEAILHENFTDLDLDHDGALSEQELVTMYQRVYGSLTIAKDKTQAVMKAADVNKNGVIDYNGICGQVISRVHHGQP